MSDEKARDQAAKRIWLEVYKAALASPALDHCVPDVLMNRLHFAAADCAYRALREIKRVPGFMNKLESRLEQENLTKASWLERTVDETMKDEAPTAFLDEDGYKTGEER